jgi:DNA-binding MarR family transcriptional regulator
MLKLKDNVLYSVDKCFRAYHQYAQAQVKKAGYNITIDQWLLLKNVSEHPGITQNEIANLVFKDNASVTRIIQILVKDGYLKREAHPNDRRRFLLNLTESGTKITVDVNEIAISNRAAALKGVDDAQIAVLREVLDKVIGNCRKPGI